ncbi:hypothetical protein ACN20G_09000 [Streptomyces sp. BI20]|uniref:hypothetical protein n=1 Tax=Streptomyces sp. BI20 TaxID=3403460 RepID=UPI003C748331
MTKITALSAAAGLVILGAATAPSALAAEPELALHAPEQQAVRLAGGPVGGASYLTVDTNLSAAEAAGQELVFTVPLPSAEDIVVTSDPAATWQKCAVTAADPAKSAPAVLTCKVPGSTARSLTLALIGQKQDKTFPLQVSAAAPGKKFKPATTKLTVGATELLVSPQAKPAQAPPGAETRLRPTFVNAGGTELAKVDVTLRTTRGLDLVETYTNCKPTPGDVWTTVVCSLEGPFKPGTVYELTKPVTAKTDKNAFADLYELSAAPGASGAGVAPAKGAGTPLTATAKGSDAGAARTAETTPGGPATWRASARTEFATTNTADFRALPGKVTGVPGAKKVRASFGFHNAGPAWIGDPVGGAPAARVDIVLPAGVSVDTKPAACAPVTEGGTTFYRCLTGPLAKEGTDLLFPFELSVAADAKAGGKGGSVHVTDAAGKAPAFDRTPGNDTAAIVLDTKAATTSPAPTGTKSPKPSTSVSATPSRSATASPSASRSTGATTGATGGNNTTPNGSLSNTGSDVVPLALGAAGIVVAGGALVFAFRRRSTGGDAA